MVDCSLSLYMGFSGDDRNSVAFQTGYEISQVNQYSVSTLYNNIVEQVLLLLACGVTVGMHCIPDDRCFGSSQSHDQQSLKC